MKKSIVLALPGILLLTLLTVAAWADYRPAERVHPVPAYNPRAAVWRTLEMPRAPKSGDLWTNPVDGAALVYIPEEHFTMGNNEVPDERPRRHMKTGGYWIGRTEVTVAQYRRFCTATGHAMPATPSWGWTDPTPIVNVDWAGAAAYARWANGRLPSEVEWE